MLIFFADNLYWYFMLILQAYALCWCIILTINLCYMQTHHTLRWCSKLTYANVLCQHISCLLYSYYLLISISIYVCVCVYIYIYLCVYMYICVYMCIYIYYYLHLALGLQELAHCGIYLSIYIDALIVTYYLLIFVIVYYL